MTATPAPMGKPYRVSSDAAWPLRGADGRTFAERKAADVAAQPMQPRFTVTSSRTAYRWPRMQEEA